MKRTLVLALALASTPAPAMDYTGVFTAPPRHVPTRGMPDGPLLGNGDVGVVLAGPPEAQVFYLGKNDFWTRHPANAKVINVGRVELNLPALQGATYRQEQDLARAEVRGTFTKAGLTVRTRSWVDANTNLLLTELLCDGGEPVNVSVRVASGASDGVPAQVADNDRPASIGRELHGGGRWFFAGEMADVVVTNGVLSGEVPRRRGGAQSFDGRTTGANWLRRKWHKPSAWRRGSGSRPRARRPTTFSAKANGTRPTAWACRMAACAGRSTGRSCRPNNRSPPTGGCMSWAPLTGGGCVRSWTANPWPVLETVAAPLRALPARRMICPGRRAWWR